MLFDVKFHINGFLVIWRCGGISFLLSCLWDRGVSSTGVDGLPSSAILGVGSSLSLAIKHKQMKPLSFLAAGADLNSSESIGIEGLMAKLFS